MPGLRKVKLNLLRGDENWKTFLDRDLVDFSDNKRQELLDRASSEGRRRREEEDMNIWKKHVLTTPNAVLET